MSGNVFALLPRCFRRHKKRQKLDILSADLTRFHAKAGGDASSRNCVMQSQLGRTEDKRSEIRTT